MSNYDLGTTRGRIVIDSSGAEAGARKAERAVGRVTGRWQASSRGLGKVGGGLAGIGLALFARLALAVNTASAFEKQISGIAAVSGASGKELDQIRQKALQLGKDTVFSASEAANAIEELVKAGVSTKDVLNGAADAAFGIAVVTSADSA